MRRSLQPKDNKYSRGVIAVAAGSDQYPGAAILTVGGARRGNAGYVKYFSKSERLQDLVITSFPDVVPIDQLHGARLDALVIGPGAASISREEIPARIPIVLDGEAISIMKETGFISDHPITVITPHEGELRFCGVEISHQLSNENRERIGLEIAREFGVIVVLKGNQTVIAVPEGEVFVDEVGGPELATAGSGDILAGLIGSMLVSLKEGGSAFDLVARAVTLHSRAGAEAKSRLTSVTATDLLEYLARV
jgi:hydroxyethylthiazole kinase-like uncharacterized protein yjeF